MRSFARLGVATAALVMGALPATAKDTIEWDFPGYYGINAPTTKLLTEFADEVEQKTDGRLKITVLAAGELPYSASEYHRIAGNGDVQLADTAWLSGDIAAAGALTLPLLVRNFGELRTAMDAALPAINSDLERFGAKVLFYYSFPVANFWGTGEPPANLEAFSGRKIRGLTPEHSDLISQLGGAPVTIATPEVITALQYGTVDTAITSAFGITGAKWNDMIDWKYSVDLAPSPSFVVVNTEAYEALPDDVRATLDEVAAEWSDKMLDAIEEAEVQSTETLKEGGLEVVEASDEDMAELQPIAEGLWEKWPDGRNEQAGEALAKIRESLGR